MSQYIADPDMETRIIKIVKKVELNVYYLQYHTDICVIKKWVHWFSLKEMYHSAITSWLQGTGKSKVHQHPHSRTLWIPPLHTPFLLSISPPSKKCIDRLLPSLRGKVNTVMSKTNQELKDTCAIQWRVMQESENMHMCIGWISQNMFKYFMAVRTCLNTSWHLSLQMNSTENIVPQTAWRKQTVFLTSPDKTETKTIHLRKKDFKCQTCLLKMICLIDRNYRTKNSDQDLFQNALWFLFSV